MVGIHLYTYFNPRSREGSDGMVRSLKKRYAIFQSTLPRGERQKVQKQLISEIYHFNPRSREGSDDQMCPSVFCYVQFQSTLPRGERPKMLYNTNNFFNISIHAPARGATIPSKYQLLYWAFQSTLPRGERPCLAFR